MMERYDHINPWADKLQDVPLPGETGSWEAMESLLDREMPAGGGKDWRRWVLLIILLLLLIGVCNCPGVRMIGHKTADRGDVRGGTTVKKEAELGAVDTVMKKTPGLRTVDTVMKKTPDLRAVDTMVKKEAGTRKDSVAKTGRREEGKTIGGSGRLTGDGVKKEKTKRKGGSAGRTTGGVADRKPGGGVEKKTAGGVGKTTGGDVGKTTGRVADKTTVGDLGKTTGGVADKTNVGDVGKTTGGDVGKTTGQDADKTTARDRGKTTGGGADKTFSGGADKTPVTGGGNKPRAGNDTTADAKKKKTDSITAARAADRKPKADSFLQVKGWLAGAGLNQFLTLGHQQQSNFNSSGTTGGIGDYIPVPMVRYYFSRKLFVQMEAQFNTPQYTTKNLLANLSKPDTNLLTGKIEQSHLYIQKLFYFNLPLSVHYSPIPNLYLGAGIQYARLTNGVALYADSFHRIFSSNPDSVISTKVLSFKHDTTYQKLKTNEFRLLVDIDYNFKRWIVGVRYNRALSNFINLQLYNNQITQSRNSSFQIYLRYIIWDGRKKKLLPK